MRRKTKLAPAIEIIEILNHDPETEAMILRAIEMLKSHT